MTIFTRPFHSIYQSSLTVLLSCAIVGCLADSPESPHESTGQYIDNSVLTAQVKSKLLADSMVKSLPIVVTSYKNRVQLSGFVDSLAQERRAVEVARSVSGVVLVEDHLSVKR